MHVTTKRGRTNASHENDKELRLGPEGVKDELELRAESPGAEGIIGREAPSPRGSAPEADTSRHRRNGND